MTLIKHFMRVQMVLPGLLAMAVMMVINPPVFAGDPDDTIGPANPNVLVCKSKEDGKYINLENDAFPGTEGGTIDFDPTEDVDVSRLENECEDENGFLEYIAQTEIEGYLYEYVPSPEDPDEWIAIPRPGIPVIAEGIDFEIYWITEKDPAGYFYFYKTRFGSGPILLNAQLPPDATPLNPNIRIESTGFLDTWTVYLGFYRGDVEPPPLEELRTPDGQRLPAADTRFYDNVGLDGKTALPAVGGIKEEKSMIPTIAVAAIVIITLPLVGVIWMRKNKGRDDFEDR